MNIQYLFSADIFLSADESIIAGNLDVTQTLYTEKENFGRSNEEPAVKVPQTKVSQSTAPHPGTKSSSKFL
jgi:hypothetical protein